MEQRFTPGAAPTETVLEVFFRGQRTYIQGSLILSLTAAWPALRHGLEGPVLLHDAGFTSLENCGVRAVLAAEDVSGFGTARFSVGGTSRTVRFVPARDIAPPRLGDEPSRLEGLTVAGGLSGEAFACVDGSIGDFLCAVVEANKRIHEHAADGVYDVWFTGLRKAAIPAGIPGRPVRIRLVFTNQMQRRQGNQKQTLSRVEVFGDGGAPLMPAFVCTFAYKVSRGIEA